MTPMVVLALVAAVASLAMSVTFVVAMARRNLGIVDVVWAVLVGASAILAGATGNGAPACRVLVALVGAAWSLRLASHLHVRVAGESEDGRYQAMRASLGERRLAYFAFFQMQAVSVVLFAVPFVAASANPDPSAFGLAIGVGFAVVALVGESIADRQLAAHRADPSKRGTTCRTGLWSRSRHPNYFFEWLHWFAYVGFAFGGPLAPLALVGPVMMGIFLYRVSGIPWVEAQALRSRGDDYARYQREVNAFFPFPKRRTVQP